MKDMLDLKSTTRATQTTTDKKRLFSREFSLRKYMSKGERTLGILHFENILASKHVALVGFSSPAFFCDF